MAAAKVNSASALARLRSLTVHSSACALIQPDASSIGLQLPPS